MLVCLASGFYPGNPSVLWFHRGLPVPPRAISTDIIREDDGTFYLHTAYRFIPTVEDHTGACVCQPLSHLVSGHESILLCTASRFYPGNPSVLWFHRNLPVPPSNITNDIIGENDGTFSLRSQYRFIPSEADHTAECFCQVAHPVWTGRRTVNITLDVLYGPSAVSVTSHWGSVANGFVSVAVGSTVNLTCSADGNPSPKIQWLSGDITKLNSSECLYIASVLKEAEGLYWCVAQNQYGVRNTSITLLVTYSAGVSTCLLVKLLLIGILILMDTIMFTIFIIRKTRTGRLEIPELSVSQPLQPQGESLAQSSNSHGT
ncbi:hypothetical protein SKAU_G00033370 [Synaphobranchus kaupii]|uniref:Ig-like domain-containing protein n=1 Tax=Synaphobranchus kaupii TaxID=118154 RepID=A0A9Q1JGG8_SYNKA|nr:hypothetical protein SKAU_G00033370 [Synaphobranchus kaupii]